eukprot:COSAG02_NODE_795_length_17133_cov_6.577727_4_plen_77_part_00
MQANRLVRISHSARVISTSSTDRSEQVRDRIRTGFWRCTNRKFVVRSRKLDRQELYGVNGTNGLHAPRFLIRRGRG